MRKLLDSIGDWMKAHPKRSVAIIFVAGFLLNAILFSGVAHGNHSPQIGETVMVFQYCTEDASDRILARWQEGVGSMREVLEAFVKDGKCFSTMNSNGIPLHILGVQGPFVLANGEAVWKIEIGENANGEKWITIIEAPAPPSRDA